MRTTIILLFICLIILLLSCDKSDKSDSELSGTWIELTNNSDTIDFDGWNSDNVFGLRRGYESIDSQKILKFGSGIYRYKLQTDTIMLNNMLWNCMCYNSYFFQMNSSEDTFEIGNFFDTSKVEHQRMTFFRIE